MIDDRLYYLRDPGLIIVAAREGYLLLAGEDACTEYAASPDPTWSRLWQCLMQPLRGRDLDALLRDLPVSDRAAVATMIAREHILAERDPARLAARRDAMFTEGRSYHLQPRDPAVDRLIIACAGSIVSGLMAPIVLSLCYCGFQNRLELILTRSATRFVTRDLFEHYGVRTWVDGCERREEVRVAHVQLGAGADCMLVMPASAASLQRLAFGACSDLLSTTAVATRAPVVVSPVMNATMWNHPAVQRNLATLRADGLYVVEPTLIVGAAELTAGAAPMYGGPGAFWQGGRGVMRVVEAVLRHARGRRSEAGTAGEYGGSGRSAQGADVTTSTRVPVAP